MAKKTKEDLRSHWSHSLDDIEYVHNSPLHFHGKEWGISFKKCQGHMPAICKTDIPAWAPKIWHPNYTFQILFLCSSLQVIGWILQLTDKYEVSTFSHQDPCTPIKKSRDVWILQINIYPMNHKSIALKMRIVYEEFLKFNKWQKKTDMVW